MLRPVSCRSELSGAVDAGHSTVDTTRPTIDVPRPVVDAPRPTIDVPRPAVDAPRFTVDVPRPAVDTPCFTVDVSRPTVDVPCFTIDVSRPTVDTQCSTADVSFLCWKANLHILISSPQSLYHKAKIHSVASQPYPHTRPFIERQKMQRNNHPLHLICSCFKPYLATC